jgi:hypothetical protein
VSEQHFLSPESLFVPEGPGDPRVWTCVRTKPRWEKRFADWLLSRKLPHFLPTMQRRQMHYRRERITELPLFPGYVFVADDKEKGDFRDSCSVLCVVKPHACQVAELHVQLWSLWRGLCCGSHLELTRELQVGNAVEIAAGPLRGVQGRFVRWTGGNRLVLRLDILGVGAAVEIPDGCVVIPA